MRNYVQIAVCTTLLSTTLAHAQGMPFGQRGNPPLPPPSNLPAGPAPLFSMAGDSIHQLTYVNSMQLMSGSLPFNRPGTPGAPDAARPQPGSPPAEAIRRTSYQTQDGSSDKYLPAPGLSAPGEFTSACQASDAGACCPPGACAPKRPAEPFEPPPAPKHTHEVCAPYMPAAYHPGLLSDYRDALESLLACFDGTVLPNAIARHWALNLLWRLNCEPYPETPYDTWASTEFLRWRIRRGPVPVPLVTTNNDPTAIGSLDEPGTRILFGGGSSPGVDFGVFTGGRVTLGSWLNCGQVMAVEGSIFMLGQRSSLFSASSAGGAAPLVSTPFFANQPFSTVDTAGESSLNAFMNPNQVNVSLTSRLWGAEANLLIDPWADPSATRNDYTGALRMLAIVGFRYLNLNENLSLTDTTIDPTNNGTITVADAFGTRNHFFGGQIGVRVGLELGRWYVDASAKAAFGINHQISDIDGSVTAANGAFGFTNFTTPGGVFAEPSNIGRFTRDVFAIVPEGQVKLVYELTQGLRPFVGYNFLYMNHVIRPGNQMDHVINPVQNTFFVIPGNTVTAPLVPVPPFRSSDFWAHGFNIGLECRF